MPLFKGTGTPQGIFADRVRRAGEHRYSLNYETKKIRKREARAERQSCYVNATLVLSTGNLACIVVNVNSLGARVEFTSNYSLQGPIKLIAPNLGLNCEVRVAWQDHGSAGLIFVKSEAGAG
jgi:hypothetical protein